MSHIITPHIGAGEGAFAKTVLMPGDPLRAKFIADNFLDKAVEVNSVRNMLGYTGFYNGHRISVMASGMGIPSIGIYAYELFTYYGVDNIVRVGSAGAIDRTLKVKDIVFALGACTNSDFALQYSLPGTFAPICSYDLLTKATAAADKLAIKYSVGNVLSSDIFYDESSGAMKWEKMGVKCVEMETAALYMIAARASKNALSVLTISDCLFNSEACSAEEREKSFTDMMKIALELYD